MMLLVVLGLAGSVLAFTGCGGDDSSSASEDTTELATTEESTETESTETESTETESTETESTETSASGDFATAENCEEFAQIGSKVSGALTGSSDVGAAKEAFDELAAAAPDEIKGDFAKLAIYMGAVAEALEGYDASSGQAPSAAAIAKLAAIDATGATAAATNVAAWVSENCSGQ
jgi:hypothetical protein